MKHAPAFAVAFLLHASLASAAETLVRLDDPAINLTFALGKQINVRFADSFAKDRLPKADYDGLVVSELPDGKVCLFGQPQGIDPLAPALAGFGRDPEGDICLPRGDVSVKVSGQTADGAPAMPVYNTEKSSCVWSWKAGKGIGLWTEDCQFESGRWDVAYDEGSDLFALRVDAGDPFPVVRHWRKDGGLSPEQLLPELKANGLVLDDAECVFEVSAEQAAPAGWTQWHVKPIGKRKAAYDAQPADEVPEPACGELGYAVDFIGFFMVHKNHPNRVVYVNLGQDGTMIDLPSITLTK
jgi:hypothetical protein